MRKFIHKETAQRLTENEVEVEIAKFLQRLGWRRQRNHVGRFRTESGARVAVGTVGYPDWTYRRTLQRGIVEILHVETKGANGKATKAQLEAVAALNHLGEPATIANSLEDFVLWYRDQAFVSNWRAGATIGYLYKPVVDLKQMEVRV